MGNHRRFFISPEQIDGSTAVLTGDPARQISKVLRLKEGDFICLLDGTGNEHDALISALSKDEVTARILGTNACSREPRLRVTLAVCLPKGDKLELIVQKCSELGISKYVIVNSERTVARPDSSKSADRLARWRRIAAEAAEQCGRAAAPEVEGIIEFSELAGEISSHQLALVAWEEESGVSLKSALQANQKAETVILIIGPEGGLTEEEVALAKSAGAISVSLGKRLMRVETAAVAASAVIMYELEGEL
ncbi:MAG: 16S rRNA (uracil(1498)-N(3))-methyltransferase [Armatimonadetes bacterium]|nr:16S rRNA (uracil(1498)-N(3))-methyltransferase [Armatimonadota bacterium]